MKQFILAAVLAFTLAGCGGQQQCDKLNPPSKAEMAAAAGGAEVERPGADGSTECLVSGDRWTAEAED